MKRGHNLRKIKFEYLIVSVIIILLIILKLNSNLNMFYNTTAEYKNLMPILLKTNLSDDDYNIIFEQTGISKKGILDMKTQPTFIDDILLYQKIYQKPATVVTKKMNLITNQEKVFNEEGKWIPAFKMVNYKNGDIFLTKSTSTFNFRHGHIGIVVDAEKGKVLECIQPGTNSSFLGIGHWVYYPTFKLLRFKDEDLANKIAQYARNNLEGIPYNILSDKDQNPILSTHCSLIVWQAFNHFGIDIDPNQGLIISPEDIAKSPMFDIIQVYGFDPSKPW